VQLSLCSVFSGNNSEAIKFANIAENLDPLSLLNLTYISLFLMCTEDYPTLLKLGKKIIELEPNYFAGHYILAQSNVGLNRYEEALREIQVAVNLNKDLLTLGALGSIYALGGDKSKALSVIEEMKGFEGAETTGAMQIAPVYLYMGDFDTAYRYYDSAIENRGGAALFMKCHLNISPEFKEDLRSKELIEKMNVIY
jgi:serine/threonine-protein kinase